MPRFAPRNEEARVDDEQTDGEPERSGVALGALADAVADCRAGLVLVQPGALYPRVGLLLTLQAAAMLGADETTAADIGRDIDRIRGEAGCPEVIVRLIDGDAAVAMY